MHAFMLRCSRIVGQQATCHQGASLECHIASWKLLLSVVASTQALAKPVLFVTGI